MIYENDKLNIPGKYRNMSVSQIRQEKEKIYAQLRRSSSTPGSTKYEDKSKKIQFHF